MDYVYVWADGIHVNIRLEQEKLCLLVLIGVRADGRKELITWPTGTGSRRSPGPICSATPSVGGMRAPVLAVGDGALGFWGALREVFPQTGSSGAGSTRPATSWLHCRSPRNPRPASTSRRSGGAEDRDHARQAIRSLSDAYGAKFPKKVAKVVDDTQVLLAFYD